MTNIRVSSNRQRMAQSANDFWTERMIESAQPIPLREAPPSMLAESMHSTGKTRVVRGVLPRSAHRQAASTSEVRDYAEYPYSCVGKLLMREGSRNYVGSAWAIGRQAIFTAAHCLYDDNGSFYDDVIFIPQYKDGREPVGRYAATLMAVDQRYTSLRGDYLKFDLGVAILDRPLHPDVGAVSYAEFPVSQIALGSQVTGVGYPAGRPFDGSDMFRSTGPVVRDSAPGTTQERYFGAENDMTGGCSGGPWPDTSNVVIGLNSFVFRGESPQIMHSPYFGQGFVDLVDWAKENDGQIGESSGGDSSADNTDQLKQQLGALADQLDEIIDSL